MYSALRSPISLINCDRTPFQNLTTSVDEVNQLAWCYMHASPRPCFTLELVDELKRWSEQLANKSQESSLHDVRYMVLASKVPGVFNVGGDLHLFRELIQTKNREGLRHYAKACIDALYANISNFGRDITTIALVQGDALGGGFETALSCDVLIAERSAKMGLPEILFNLFPGMGAYSILSRKLDAARAERIILSGTLYSAEQLYEMGLVDVVVDDGQGERAVYDYIKKENRSRNGIQALRAVKQHCNPITHEELMNIVEIWVDAALRLQPRDLKMMDRLVSKQSVRSVDIEPRVAA